MENIPGGVRLVGVEHFNLRHTFLSGQCFRWDKNPDGSFTGVAFGRVIRIAEVEAGIDILNTSMDEFKGLWMNYFDLSRDYGTIKEDLSKDNILKEAITYGWGIRLLRQDTWECLVSFIISQANNIPRIKKIISALCREFGQAISMEGQKFYSFPSPERLEGITEKDLAFLHAGFRAKYIVDAVHKVLDGTVNLNSLSKIDAESGRKQLMQIKGVGSKVADCVLLFGAGRFDAFPVDVWVRRAMKGLYPDCCDECGGDIRKAGKAVFGKYCGLAQQYIFYYAREKSLFK